MHCLGCGSGTSEGVLLCSSCFERVRDPLAFVSTALDPASDRRFMALSSPTIRVAPSPSREIVLGKAPEAIMRFRSSIEGDQREVPYIMDRYLSFLGLGVDLRGDERVPRRDILSEFLEAAMSLDYDLLCWARASVCMGNLISLGLRRLATLPVDEDARSAFIDLWSERARGLYERGDAFPRIRWAALSNQALLEYWIGNVDQGLDLLDYVMKKKLGKGQLMEARIKKAVILNDLGRIEELDELLSLIKGGVRDSRLDDLGTREEGP